jgi:hypothetical protein
MTRESLLIFKGVLFRAWRLNLYKPDVTAPIPSWVQRRMGWM